MAWVLITGTNWEYDNTLTTYGGVLGIRTNSDGSQVYVGVRVAGEDLSGKAIANRGELSKTYYDAQ